MSSAWPLSQEMCDPCGFYVDGNLAPAVVGWPGGASHEGLTEEGGTGAPKGLAPPLPEESQVDCRAGRLDDRVLTSPANQINCIQ